MERRAAKDIFSDAVGLPTGERTAYILAQCGGDAALRSEVERLVASHSRAGEFLADPTVVAVAAGGNGGHEPPDGSGVEIPDERPGDRIGPYKLLQQIAAGGFGVVFVAEQERPVARRVALKVIKAGMDTRQVVARFEQERQALALMDHPNIARVFDAGATERGRPYFVMELVKGEPITTYCDKNHLAIRERLALFGQVCRAVQHAHTKGIIHRDLTPNNILVITQDGRPLAKVIDFGIAKATGARLTDKTLFTKSGELVGTPEYMSPEQAAAKMDIDTRSDVYSLGVLLYELLTGLLPFDSKVLRSAAFAEIQRIIRDIEPEKPSTRLSHATETLASAAAMRHTDPSTLTRGLRGDLDWIVMKALDKDRERRYETADAFCADIERFLRNEAVLAGPPSQMYRLRKLVRRHRAAVAGAAAVFLALAGGLAVASYGLIEAERQRSDAVRDRGLAERAAEKLKHVQEFFQGGMLGGADLLKYGDARRTILDVVESAASQVGTIQDPEVRAAVEHEVGSVFVSISEFPRGKEFLTRALKVREGLESPSGREEAAETMLKLAQAMWALEESGPAELMVLRAKAIRTQLHGAASRGVVEADFHLAEVQYQIQRRPEARRTLESAIAAMSRIEPRGQESILFAHLLATHGRYLANEGQYDRAEPDLKRAVEIHRRLYPGPSASLASALSVLGHTLAALERPAEADAVAKEAMEIRQKIVLAGSTQLAQSLQVQGIQRLRVDDVQGAEELVRTALDMYERAYPRRDFPDGNESLAVTQATLARVLVQRAAPEQPFSEDPEPVVGAPQLLTEASVLYQRAIATFKALEARGSTITGGASLANIKGQYGQCLMLQGRYAEAEALLLEAYDVLTKSGEMEPARQYIVDNLVKTYRGWGKPEKAAEWRERAARDDQSSITAPASWVGA